MVTSTASALYSGMAAGMAAKKVLTPQQIADVAEYVYRAFLHPDRFAAIDVPAAPGWQSTGVEPASAKKN
jgi:mono/diheme cytochrome c family protein